MKTLKTCAIGVLLLTCYLQSASQNVGVPLNEPDYNKPQLFADLPQKMNLRLPELEELFNEATGTSVNLLVTDQLRFQGTIVSKSSEQDALIKSVVIRSTNRAGSVFTFTRLASPDGSFSYIGRIISTNHGDAYEVINENGQYVLNKTGFYNLLNE